MIVHTSTHTLSFSISLSEVRVHTDYSLISCSLFLKHSPSHEFKLLSETHLVENPGIGGFVTFREETRIEWLMEWEQVIRAELRTLEGEGGAAGSSSLLLVACTEFCLTSTLVAGKEFCTSLRGVNGVPCAVLHIHMRETEENRLTLLFKCSAHISWDNPMKKKLRHKEEGKESRDTLLYVELATQFQTGVMYPIVTSEMREIAEMIDWDVMYAPNIREINLDKSVWIRLCERENSQKIAQTSESLRSLLTDCKHDSKHIKLTPIQSDKKIQSLSTSISIADCRIVKLPTHVDYLLGGYQLSITFAIDFTVSNGDHTFPSSYHNLSPSSDNMYMECIKSALHFIKQFSTPVNSGIPVIAYGFGAVPAHMDQISFCFALNQEEHNPLIQNSEHLLTHYTNVVRSAVASGPASLHQVIHKCLHDVMAQESYKQYRVCFVQVAAAVRDLTQVRELLVESAKYPLSFVFVGIGNQPGLSEIDQSFREDVRLISANGSRTVRSNVVYRHWKTVKLATQQKGQSVYSAFILSLTTVLMQQFREYYRLMNITPPAPANTKTSPELPYRSLAKQTSLYGQYATTDVSDIRAFQEAQLLATPSPYVSVKKESSIGGAIETTSSLDSSLIKPITSHQFGTPLTPEVAGRLHYNSYATPLSSGKGGQYTPLQQPLTPLLYEQCYEQPEFRIED